MASIKGGDKFKATIAELVSKLSKASYVEVGFKEGATYPDGTSLPLVAAINEFGRTVTVKGEKGDVGGTYYQAPRPFFRNAIAANKAKWPKNLATALKNNDFDTTKALTQFGQSVVEEIQDSIGELTSPPLAPSTVKAKGFDKPLIDTQFMQDNVTATVK